MTEENQTFTVNKDGSISAKVDGKTVKYVLESDLGAVKSALKDKESEVSKLQVELAGTTSKYDTAHQDVLKERAAKELLEKDAKEGATLRTQVAELQTQMAGLTKTSGETATKLTERLRGYLTTSYKIDKAKLEGKTLAEMENIESTLHLTGAMPATQANYDGKGGNGGSSGDLKGKGPLALAMMGYESSNKK